MGNDDIRPDPVDGLPTTAVGEWTKDKHRLLEHYVTISGGVRKRWLERGNAGVTYIDLYCAAGRSYIKGTDEFIDGSPLVAWKASLKLAPFTEIHLNDLDVDRMNVAGDRLKKLGASVKLYGGKAKLAVDEICAALNPYALHLAMIDPFKLLLPFSVMERLATFKRMDILIHVSVMDLQRNWKVYVAANPSPLDEMAPGWRNSVDINQRDDLARSDFIHYWVGLLKNLGFEGNLDFELIRGYSHRQPLYWLVLVAKHELASKFWRRVRSIGKTGELFED